MKFGAVIEYNMRDIFLDKSSTICARELFPDTFLKGKIEHISGSIVLSFIQFLFIACQVEGY